MEPDVKVTLLYAAFAVALGAVSGFIDLEPVLSLLIALFVFYISYRVAPMVFDLEDTDFETSAWNMIKKGAIPYWFMWLVAWTLVYTFMVPY